VAVAGRDVDQVQQGCDAMSEVFTQQGQAEICGKAMAEAAGFCWENCAQSQWIRDAEAGLKAVGFASLLAERDALKAVLEEIRDHWACQYDHPRKEAEMYRGSYGIGVTDGHRICAGIAHKALSRHDEKGAAR
jgi:hypothetical protein